MILLVLDVFNEPTPSRSLEHVVECAAGFTDRKDRHFFFFLDGGAQKDT